MAVQQIITAPPMTDVGVLTAQRRMNPSSFRLAERLESFGDSFACDMTRLIRQYGGINLSQGFADFPTPTALKEAAKSAIDADQNQYTVPWGIPSLLEAIAEKLAWKNGITTDPDREITVTCGAAEALTVTMLGLVDPGDEVILFEPYFETFVPDIRMCGGVPVFVPLREPGFTYDPNELERAISPRTKAIIINTPHNPTGRVFARAELEQIADLCIEHDLIAITDESYEYLLYDGREHISLATLPGLWERTVTICGLSKTYGVTGWRLGYAVAPVHLTEGLRRAHDYITGCAPAPFQAAAVTALKLPQSFYDQLLADYAQRRGWMVAALEGTGLEYEVPQSAHFILADFSQLSDLDAVDFVELMAREVGVIGAPATAFYHHKELGRHKVRFAYSKSEATLREAGRRLARLARLVS